MTSVGVSSVSFVIPVRNDARRLDVCLTSIRRNESGLGRIEIVVVDNGSEDDSAEVAARHGAHVLSFPGARVSMLRNEGVARTGGAAIAFVDADHAIVSGWVSAALARLEQTNVGAVGAPYHAPPNGTWVQRVYDLFRVHGDRPVEASWLGSGNLVVRREAFEAVGGFDGNLEACEDVDFCCRLRRAGFRIVNDPALVSVHFGDPETLRGLFNSELWRARDNLRVTLRSERSWQSFVSLAIPFANLTALVVVLVGAIVSSWLAAMAGVTAVIVLAVLRAALMVRGRRLTLRLAAQAWTVALVYHGARALALVWPGKHRHARLPRRLDATVGGAR
jgi:GT2 family glycosyltransferase